MSNPIQPDIACSLPSVADPALSPDGSILAYTYSWFDQVQMESYSRIMMMKVADGRAQEFTQGKSDSAPKFAPNGNDLGFLRRDEDGRRQLWVMGVGGGEAKRLTTAPKGVFDFGWSPDGRQVVYCADVDAEMPAQDQQANKVPKVKVVGRIRYRFDGLGWRGDAHFHLFVVSLDGDSPRQLTDGDWDDTAPVWSPDGARIAFISGRRDDRDQKALTEAYVVMVAGGEAENWSQGLSDVGVLSWSPDSRRLVAVGSDMPQGMAQWQAWLYVLEPGRPPHRLTDDSLRPFLSFPIVSRSPELRWTEDGRILFLGDQRGESRLFEVPASGGRCRQLAGGGWQSSSVSIDGNAQAAVVLSSYPWSPGELYYLDLVSTANEQLTHCNEKYLAEHPPARMEKFNVQREGLQIECRLWLPPGFDRNQQYPMVLDIHGGPNGAFYDSFTPVQQVLATSGYLILAVNPRGSSTYGKEFMMSVLGDWGGEDYQDLMAAVDEVASRPYVDEQRLGVHGYSYGGFMTSWIVGHNDRFKAAVVGAPCIDLYSMYGTSDIGVSFGEDQWGGTLMDAAQALIKHSPITYAANVNAPVLLLHGEADARCPVAQSEEYFVVLKRLGKEVEFVRFPECNHLFPRMGHPKMREEYLARTLGWFQRWLG
jgi:dipeptidyl aminopeptidase/acylaminoacyl peptidase